MAKAIPGKGITPEAAEALGIPETDPRVATDSDVSDNETDDTVDAVIVDDGISGPFPLLSVVGDPEEETVPAGLSSGDSIPDVGIGNGEGVDENGPTATPSGRSRISRLHRGTGDDKQEPKDPSSKPPSLDEWVTFFGKIVLKLACDWYLSFAFRGIDEDIVSDHDLERLGMTDDERKLIATPLAELSNKSKFMRKHGRTMVASGDAFYAMVTLGKWMSRVNRIAARYRPRRNMTVNGTVQGNGNSGQGTETPGYSSFTTGATNGRVPDGYPIYRPGGG